MSEQTIKMVPIGKIKPDPNQPRTEWDEHQEHVEELAASYSKHGIIQPLEVDENSVIILGECRWRAAKKVGLKTIPVRKMEGLSQEDRLERQLIDDAQRQELGSIERRWAYAAGVASINDLRKTHTIPQVKRMWKRSPEQLLTLLADTSRRGENGKQKSTGQSELARRIGIPQSTISYLLAYFDERVPNVAREAADAGLLGPTEISEIRRVKTEKAKKAIVASVTKERKSGSGRLSAGVSDRVDAIRSLEKDAKAEKIPEPSEELIKATARAEVSPDAVRHIAEVETRFQPAVIESVKKVKAVQEFKEEADIAQAVIKHVPRKPRVELGEEQLAEIRERVKATDEMMQRARADPLTQRKARFTQSWLHIQSMLDAIGPVVCPVCEKSAENNLVFKCHPDITLEKAEQMTSEERQKMDAEELG